MISIQGGAALAKTLFPAVGAIGTSALRLSFSAVMLTLAMRPWRLKLDRAGWRAAVPYGLSLAGMNLLFYLAVERIPLGIAVAIEFTGPLVLAVLSSHRAVDFLWVALAACGLWVLLPHDAGGSALDPWGVFYAAAAGVCWAAYIVYGRRASLKGGVPMVALASIVAAAAVLPIGLAQGGTAMFSLEILPYALGVAFLSSALPYALEVWVLARLPARVFGTLLSLESACAALSGLVFLGETLTLAQWLGVAAIAAASAGVTATRGRD
ncbi:EamA family transporter [Bordetella genomosp. 13]|uniref:EamA family transporter n=1 Tax=Bordetella genomosp. 13 TaxID=463040 RepID=UPI0011A7C1BF|nr:EamA family transporter [Bordetella genomosp. 13]